MTITYTVTTAVGSLTHSFKDEKLVKGFQELEDMLGDKAEPTPRTILLRDYMNQNGLWGKAYENHFITEIERTDDGEHWHFNQVQ
jgi:hypothetical protein